MVKITTAMLRQWEAEALKDEVADKPFCLHPTTMLEVIKLVRPMVEMLEIYNAEGL